MDFDGDGEEELLVIYLNNKEEQDGETISKWNLPQDV